MNSNQSNLTKEAKLFLEFADTIFEEICESDTASTKKTYRDHPDVKNQDWIEIRHDLKTLIGSGNDAALTKRLRGKFARQIEFLVADHFYTNLETDDRDIYSQHVLISSRDVQDRERYFSLAHNYTYATILEAIIFNGWDDGEESKGRLTEYQRGFTDACKDYCIVLMSIARATNDDRELSEVEIEKGKAAIQHKAGMRIALTGGVVPGSPTGPIKIDIQSEPYRSYQFGGWAEAQEFLDNLPPRSGVYIAEAPRLFELLNTIGAPQYKWQEIIDEINEEWDTVWNDVNGESRRDALLSIFKATMVIAEATIDPEDLENFREARRKHYASFIYQESTVGGNLCVETLNAVTLREIAAGRMTMDNSCRQLAIKAMAEPHLTREELQKMETDNLNKPMSAPNAPPSMWMRIANWISQ